MWAILGGLLSDLWSAIGNFFLGWIRDSENQKLGEDKQAVADLEAARTVQAKGDAAVDAVAPVVSSDDGLRKYEQTDPNNRDA